MPHLPRVTHIDEGRQVLVAERGPIVFVFNFRCGCCGCVWNCLIVRNCIARVLTQRKPKVGKHTKHINAQSHQ